MAFPQFEVMNTVTEMDIATTISGTTARNGIHLTVTDSGTAASGRSAGLKIAYTAAGAKTATGYVDGISVDVTITGTNPLTSGIYIHTNTITGNPTLGMVIGLYIDLNDSGTDCERYFAFNIDMGQTSVIAGESGVMRFRNSGSQMLNSIFQIEANNPAAHLFYLTTASLPYHSSNVSVQDGRIAVKVGSTTKYLATYAS